MSKIPGKYEHSKNENLKEFIVGLGQGAEFADKAESVKAVMDVTFNGTEISIKTSYATKETVLKFTFGTEFDDPMPNGLVLKSIASQEGDKVVVKSKKDGQEIGGRTYTFTDKEVIIEMTSVLTPVVCKRYYKRV